METRSLKEISTIVGDAVENDHVMDIVHDWELKNGSDIYYENEETGKELTPDERQAYLKGDYEGDVNESAVDIYQWFIISRSGADFLMRRTEEIVYYSPSLEMYVWAIDDFGTPWEAVRRIFLDFDEAKPGLDGRMEGM